MTKAFYLIALLPSLAAADCIVGEPYPFESPADCPPLIQEYLERTGACAHFAGEDAYDEERAEFLNAQMEELRCAELGKRFTDIMKHYEGDVLYFRLIDAYHQTYGIAYPGE